ncbi:TolC family protein [Plebeiibacterium marinum]|uniref:TolC family protein n=1 Tax=Plebeiibacterium marinum TaxID=2992111 RepID=A0AAE3MGE6_9BACT|nr:TolC family protein [Plebeiobacterium marinum]MCW3807104.1 TolC family protein [Plebeiobacterium marinum]
MHKIYISLILFLVLGLSLKAQQQLLLADAIAKGLDNNYSVKIVKNNQRISEINNSWGAAGAYPYIDFSIEDNNAYNVVDGGDNYNRYTLSSGVSLCWTVFNGFAVRINKKRFEELEELSKQNTAVMIESTIQSIVLAYFDALLQKDKLEVAKEVMKLSEDRFVREEESRKLGSAVTYDVLQAKNAYLSDQSSYLLQEVNYKNALRDLTFLMGEKGTEYFLADSFEAKENVYELADLEAQMMANNKSLQNQYVNQRLLENAIVMAKSAYSPSLALRAGANGSSIYTSTSDAWSKSANLYGALTLNYNLFSGGSRKRAMAIARIDEEIGTVELEEKKHELSNSLANLYELFMVRKQLLAVAEDNLEAARLNLQISKEKFETGAINSFNYRDVQNIYLNASQYKLEAIYNYIDTHHALLRMVGSIVQYHE